MTSTQTAVATKSAPTVPTANDLFQKAFTEELGDIPIDDYVISGRPSKAHPRGEDVDWWRAEGPLMVQRWMDYMETTPWEIWVAPDGRPGIEMEFKVRIGGNLIVMYADVVFATAPNNQRPTVVDAKSGQQPQNQLQIGLYKLGVELTYPGINVFGGAYWNGRTGLMSEIHGLSWATEDYYSKLYQRLQVADLTGTFLPNPGRICSTCSVGRFCAVNNGRDAHLDPDYALMGKR